MRILTRLLLAALFLVATSSASAGVIRATAFGSSSIDISVGAIVPVDLTITVGAGDTLLGGAGAGYSISLVTDAGLASLGPQTIPLGWTPGPRGPCTLLPPTQGHVNSRCDGAAVASDPAGSGFALLPGTTTLLATVLIDTTGIAIPSVASFVLTGPGDGIFAFGGVDVSSEYVTVGMTIGQTLPEPSTGLLLAAGLAVLACRGAWRR